VCGSDIGCRIGCRLKGLFVEDLGLKVQGFE
jgi:hypothetical protein